MHGFDWPTTDCRRRSPAEPLGGHPTDQPRGAKMHRAKTIPRYGILVVSRRAWHRQGERIGEYEPGLQGTESPWDSEVSQAQELWLNPP